MTNGIPDLEQHRSSELPWPAVCLKNTASEQQPLNCTGKTTPSNEIYLGMGTGDNDANNSQRKLRPKAVLYVAQVFPLPHSTFPESSHTISVTNPILQNT